jgi:hypothetical protein
VTIAAARRFSQLLEPLIGQVYFSPECHTAYEALGFGPSPRLSGQVALPDGPAYFTSRGASMGQVPGEVVAATFAVFNPEIVVPCVDIGWSLTDAATISAARDDGATGQLRRILGEEPEGMARAADLMERMTDPLRPAGRALFAGVRSMEVPTDPVGRLWRHGDMLREYRGDSHIAAWIAAGLDPIEIGLLTELWLGIPVKSYIRSRAWSTAQLDDGLDRLQSRGFVRAGDDGLAFTDAGRAHRGDIEDRTDQQMAVAIDALGDDVDELFGLLQPWSEAVVAAGGYLGSPADLVPSGR